jgi:hypothetical protein
MPDLGCSVRRGDVKEQEVEIDHDIKTKEAEEPLDKVLCGICGAWSYESRDMPQS